MIDFKTAYSDRENGVIYTSEPGSPYLVEYEYEFSKDESGNNVRKLVKTDRVTDVHARIQADFPSTDIDTLLKRFSLGDASALDARKGLYFDATDMPKNYVELFDRVEKAKTYFYTLPPEVREKFANSPENFYSMYGSDAFNKIFSDYNDSLVDHKYDEKTESNDIPKENF